jgi:hypothetical protein
MGCNDEPFDRIRARTKRRPKKPVIIAVVVKTEDEDASSYLVTTPENIAANPNLLDSPDDQPSYSIRGASWEAIMQAYYDIEGFGIYRVPGT